MNWSTMLVLFFIVGCSSDQLFKGSPVQTEENLSETTSLQIQPRKFSKGEVLYIRYCGDCHGWEGRGNGPVAEYIRVPTPALQNRELLAAKSESQFVDLVLNGRPTSIVPLLNNAGPQTESEVTALLAHLRKLPSIDLEKTNAGQQVYDELCVSCHGLYGRGDGALASQMPVSLPDLSVSDYQNQHSDNELLQIIAKGKNAMPGTEDILDPEEIKAVIAFIRLFSPGYESYDRFCAACHGPDGSPMEYVVLTEEQDMTEYEDIYIPALDDVYLETHSEEQLRKNIQHMLEINSPTMPHFAEELVASEVRQIYQYLKSLISRSSS